MTYKEIATLVGSIDLPYAYYQFTQDTAVPPPFVCFYCTQSDDEYADNANYQRIETLNIELYSDDKDYENEAVVEAALTNAGLTWSRNEAYIGDQRLYMVTYQTEVVITQEV